VQIAKVRGTEKKHFYISLNGEFHWEKKLLTISFYNYICIFYNLVIISAPRAIFKNIEYFLLNSI